MAKIKVKEIRMWLKGLDENKWRNIYGVDAKRIAFFANNGSDAELPVSLQRRTENWSYNRDKRLSEDYLKHLSSLQEEENKVRKVIRNILKEMTSTSATPGYSLPLGMGPKDFEADRKARARPEDIKAELRWP